MADEAVNQLITDYYRNFSTLNVQSILPHFHEPSLLIGPQGVIPIPNHAALVAVFGPVMESLRAKGYGRSELELTYVDLAWLEIGGDHMTTPSDFSLIRRMRLACGHRSASCAEQLCRACPIHGLHNY